MPYCVQCGTQVGTRDQFCAKCGVRQASAGSPPPPFPQKDVLSGISSRHAALMCYIPMLGWIAAIVVLASDRFRRDMQVRFHAFQGLYVFVAWLMVEWVISPMVRYSDYGFGHELGRLIPRCLQLLVLGAWVLMIIKVSQGEDYKLPVVGELAERSASEQRF